MKHTDALWGGRGHRCVARVGEGFASIFVAGTLKPPGVDWIQGHFEATEPAPGARARALQAATSR